MGNTEAQSTASQHPNSGTDSRELIIREAAAEEGHLLEAVLYEAYSQYEQELPQDVWVAYKAGIAEATRKSSTIAKLVAELDGEIVGSVFVYASSETAYGNAELGIHSPIIRLLGVTGKARGRGVATELIRASVRLASERGADTLYLHTSDMMGAAIRLYERLGFERALDKEFMTGGNTLVKSYRLQLADTLLLQ
ncbi:GNAT family N-acetyltransferase [Paenibacillus sp. 1781tsa1]|uniref:GNAT family N-acetyltransferase n=1 Tax=Paenibacillus sp. 1781tsa1 TaxID=2953810 RepID=UPI0020A08FA7|nr:GNAT family N-acetyltransferase [Paenibacillus sp. 1781tsa1]MCP1182917.1 GNAT family N-acetyltransferase [Paenibacillus sp. 1781tsa1]